MRIQGIPESESEEVDYKFLVLVNEPLKLSPPLNIEDIEVVHHLPGGTTTCPHANQRLQLGNRKVPDRRLTMIPWSTHLLQGQS